MTQWFRFYRDAINDPKILKLPEVIRWRWVATLSAASGCNGVVPPADDLALMLRITMQQTLELITILERAGLIDKTETGYAPHNWSGRQYKTDVTDPTAATRNKRCRDKKRNARNAEKVDTVKSDRIDRIATVSLIRPEQSRADTEADQIRPDPEKEGSREVALVPSDWPADFFEQFWKKYPNKVDPKGSKKKLAKAGNAGIDFKIIMDGLDRYVAKTDDRPWCNPTTWINQSRWEEQHTTVRSNNGFQPRNTRRTGHDAILASANRKARKLDQQDGLARSENQTELAGRIDAHGDRTRGDGTAFGSDQHDHYGLEFDPGRVLEGEIIAPDKNAARVPDFGQLV